MTWQEARGALTYSKLWAEPVSDGPRSPWITAYMAALKAVRKVVGQAEYQARAGSCTWLNGVYWLKVIEPGVEGRVIVENLHDVGKIPIPRARADIEPDLLYPLLRGRDVGRWRAHPSAHILVTQDPGTRTGYDEVWMRTTLTHTYLYLKQFESQLRKRSGYRKYFDPEVDPFYTMYNVAEYTFSPIKVVWGALAHTVSAAVVVEQPATETLPVTPVVADHSAIHVSSRIWPRPTTSARSSTPRQPSSPCAATSRCTRRRMCSSMSVSPSTSRATPSTGGCPRSRNAPTS